MNFRRPDVVIGTKDWESVEGFLRNVLPDKMAEMREPHKYHVRIVLQSGERWYLNLLVSETARQSRIISTAATKLGRGNVHDKRMHLRDVNGKEVSISIDMVGTMKELLEDEDPCRGSPKPHMVLCPEDERRIKGTMLVGWMSEADLFRMGQPGQEEESACLGSRGEEVRGGGVLQAPQGEDQGTRDAHLGTVQQGRTGHLDWVQSGCDPRVEGRPSPPPGDHGRRKSKSELRLV